MWGCVVAEIFWTLFVSRDSHSTIPDTGSIGYYFQATAVQVKRFVHRHCSATVTSPGLVCTAKWLGNNTVLCQGAGRELGHQESNFFAPKRVPHVRKFFDELSSDSRLESGEKRFQVEVFNTVIDITTSQLKTRFHSLQKTDEHFFCIKPSVILEKNMNELLELSKVLVKVYTEEISDEPCDQIMLLKLKLADVKTAKELAEFLLIKHAELSSTFSEVITACLLYLTLPVTVASAERSFSKLKLIKAYLRSIMCQVRLKFSRNAVNRESTLKWSKRRENNRHFRRRKCPQKTFLNSDLLLGEPKRSSRPPDPPVAKLGFDIES